VQRDAWNLRGRTVEVHAARVHARVPRQHVVEHKHAGHVVAAEKGAAAQRAAIGPMAGPLVPLAPRVVRVDWPLNETNDTPFQIKFDVT